MHLLSFSSSFLGRICSKPVRWTQTQALLSWSLPFVQSLFPQIVLSLRWSPFSTGYRHPSSGSLAPGTTINLQNLVSPNLPHHQGPPQTHVWNWFCPSTSTLTSEFLIVFLWDRCKSTGTPLFSGHDSFIITSCVCRSSGLACLSGRNTLPIYQNNSSSIFVL